MDFTLGSSVGRLSDGAFADHDPTRKELAPSMPAGDCFRAFAIREGIFAGTSSACRPPVQPLRAGVNAVPG